MLALNFKARVDPLTLSPACNGFLRFTSAVTPAELLVASMVTKPFSIHTCTHKYNHLWGSSLGSSLPLYCCLPDRCLFVILVVIVNLLRLLIGRQVVLGCNWLIVLSGRFPGCDWLPVGCYGSKTRSTSSSNRRTVL